MESRSRTSRDQIASVAQYRCEYCQTAQDISGAQMHIEHIIPLSRGGSADASNLCLACAWCNSYKWAHTHGFDPETRTEVLLFHPRTQRWYDHFRWSEDGAHIIGLTAIGRATVETLKMNNAYIVPARRHWVEAGWHPTLPQAPADANVL
jgi:HNH endonuclease